MNTKVNEGKLISGKEALTKVTEGIVQCKCDEDPVADRWTTITDHSWDQYNLGVFLNENTTWKFRFKPRTITINGIEVPAPFEPKEGEDCRCYCINTAFKHGFDWYHSTHHKSHRVAWRTEEEIKQVISALRFVLNGGWHEH